MKSKILQKTLLSSTLMLLAFMFITCKHEPNPILNGRLLPKNPYTDTTGYNYHAGPIYGSSGDTIKDSICFGEEILPIILSNCAMSGCHDGSTQGGDAKPLLSYTNVMSYVRPHNANGSNLYQSITGNGQDIMPPAPNNPLTAAQIQLIYNWIMQGAKNNIDCGMGCDTTLFTFSGSINPILQTYCNGCHSGGTAGAGISLIGYNNVMVYVNNGKLWGSVNHTTGFYAMPLNGPILDSCRITQIKKWIAAGALNN